MSPDLQAAKISLYRLLLEIEPEQMTDTEIEIMFQLCMDTDIIDKVKRKRNDG